MYGINFFFIKVDYGSENENENQYEHSELDGAYGGGDDTVEYTQLATAERRSVTKRQWITPRLCSALDKAEVKKMRLKN